MYHTSNPKFRKSILENGLMPTIGEQRCFGNELLPPAIFLCQIEAFNSCYDDDIYSVDIEIDKLLLDNAMPDAYYTLEPIDICKIKIIHFGTGDFVG